MIYTYTHIHLFISFMKRFKFIDKSCCDILPIYEVQSRHTSKNTSGQLECIWLHMIMQCLTFSSSVKSLHGIRLVCLTISSSMNVRKNKSIHHTSYMFWTLGQYWCFKYHTSFLKYCICTNSNIKGKHNFLKLLRRKKKEKTNKKVIFSQVPNCQV